MRKLLLIMGAALFVEFCGFMYDKYWHDMHLSMVVIPPAKLLTIHGAIYAGQLVVLAVALFALARLALRPPAMMALWLVVAGGLVQLAGTAGDMYTHANGYERPLFHDLIHLGAGVTVAGYLVLELLMLWPARQELADEPPAEPARSDAGRKAA